VVPPPGPFWKPTARPDHIAANLVRPKLPHSSAVEQIKCTYNTIILGSCELGCLASSSNCCCRRGELGDNAVDKP
jgi:hypothetical protein